MLLVVCIIVSGTSAAAEEKKPAPTLYERLGGLGPISVVVSDFIEEMVPDEMLNKNPAINKARKEVPAPYLKYRVTSMVCSATGGPCAYTGKDMRSSHAHLNISEAEWDRMVEIFKGVLNEHNVPAKEQDDLLAIVGSTKSQIVTTEKTQG